VFVYTKNAGIIPKQEISRPYEEESAACVWCASYYDLFHFCFI